MRRLISVAMAVAAGALAGALLWVMLLYLGLGVRRITPHYDRMLGQMTATMSFGTALISIVAAANGLAQVVIVIGGRPAVGSRALLVRAFLADMMLLVFSALLLDHGIMLAGAEISVVFHWATIAMILSRKRLRFSHVDAAYIVAGAIINLAAARVGMDWILATR
jgi:hypothetical protein